MWLINTKSLALVKVSEPSSTKYAILSHTWEGDEITFQEFRDLEPQEARQKVGYTKIVKTCELAQERGLDFAWVDTCCIDKSNSAELNEAINSMFAWYKNSTVCFVHLSDLKTPEDHLLPRLLSTKETGLEHSFPCSQSNFGACRWFTRGWTLQELIAPDHVEFFDSQWTQFSQKKDCVDILAEITGISQSVLESSSNLRQIPIAVKMSWAAHRETKHVEDRAYSLLGIFDINMPIMYGEGPGAFRRLQEEISKESNDLSLFAWRSPLPSSEGSQVFRGIFARSPSEFSNCSQMQSPTDGLKPGGNFVLTSKGVRFDAELYQHTKSTYTLYLGLTMGGKTPVCIFLSRMGDMYVRTEPWLLEYDRNVDELEKMFTVHVQKDVSSEDDVVLRKNIRRCFHVDIDRPKSIYIEHIEPNPEHLWDAVNWTFLSSDSDKSFAHRLTLFVRCVRGGLNKTFPLTLMVGWSRLRQQPFAVLYDARMATDTDTDLSIAHTLPHNFPELLDLLDNDTKWDRSHEVKFENALSRVLPSKEFQSTEVQLLHKKPMLQQPGKYRVTPYVATLNIELKTQQTWGDKSTVTYSACLSGELSQTEASKIV
ncbi:HET domain-containing protein [Colletotrichum truncatum]|uniref:HET domain-containing protein n=1 Tax=Colletotrichum truncatum TaxID=5467 RepID=A0ACC3YSV7_COLTU|nr:HET domain-containing protein [Colletotrichum truncatum]KAF6782167.1 HET domain-containing protein [Colletotrichum truncatum]